MSCRTLILLMLVNVGVGTICAAETVLMRRGSTRVLDLAEIARSVEIETSGVVDVTKGATKANLVIFAKGEGSTLLHVVLQSGGEREFKVVVSSGRATVDLVAVRAKILAIPGLSAEVHHDKILVEGRLASREDASRFGSIKGAYGDVIMDGTERVVDEENGVVRSINRVLEEHQLRNYQAHSYGRMIALEGSPQNDQERDLALGVARGVYSATEDRVSRSSKGGPSIGIEVMFVEVQKKNAKEIGFEPTVGSAPPGEKSHMGDGADGEGDEGGSKGKDSAIGRLSGEWSGSKGGVSWHVGPIAYLLRLIESRSVSRVLSNPKLIARSGETATFHSGGAFFLNRKTVDKNGEATISAMQIDTGITLDIQPTMDATGQIDSDILTSIRDLGDEPIAGFPSLIESRVNTAVTVRTGQTLLLSGLVRKRNSKLTTRIPILADIPIIGELFKTRVFKDESSELMVLVTMTSIEADSEFRQALDGLWAASGDDVAFSIFD